MARVGLVTPEQRAWAWYDWANSAFFTTVVTAVFPGFYASYAAAGLAPAEATARFGLVTTVSMATIAISAPVLGAFADYSGSKKRLLALFIAIGVTACGSMVFIGEGEIGLASLLFFIANIGVSGSIVFYDSLLPHVARAEETDRVSAAGYAMGYLGGGLLLLINLAWILQPAMFGFSGTVPAIKASFFSVAVWWAVFSLPIFRKVPEPLTRTKRPSESGMAIVAAFARLATTFREVRKYRNAFLLFIAMLLYQDGIQTIIRMAGVYGAEVGVEQTSQIAAFVMVQFLGIPFTFLFGSLGVRIGTKRAIFIAISVYALATVLAYFMTTVTHFFILAAMIATVQGGAQALSRALFSRMVPADRTSEFFGFFAVAERFATVLGPLVFTLSVTLTGSSKAAIIAILGFFVAGAWVLSMVDEEEGIRAARG
ncbi:MAG: MFS transporter [Acidobacteria bacterium]|nr:MFS transporter [Acidobacteriota bacterium]MSO62129.1 MFS transporter [Acidobacteriota bacterium]